MAPVCYANPNPSFQPAMRLIASISNANPAVVTTTFAHQYNTGLIVRLDIPVADGMQEINSQTGAITVTSPTTFNFPVDSTKFSVFSIPINPLPNVNTCAQVVPVGEVSSTLNYATQNVLPFGPL